MGKPLGREQQGIPGLPQPTSDLETELTAVIQDLTQLQSELHYRRAQELMRELVGRLDLTQRERTGLDQEIHGLEDLLTKLDLGVVQIAAFGMVGRGKSSLLNALLGQPVFATGPTHGVTQTIQRANWSVRCETIPGSDRPIMRVTLPGGGQSRMELIDTPGIDEVGGEAREILAQQVAHQADLILFVIAGDMTQVEHAALSELRRAKKPMLLVFNKIDQYPEEDRQAIYTKVRDERVRELLSADEVVLAAAAPRFPQATRQADGSLQVELTPKPAQVEDLKLKILTALDREGKSLVALNTMLYAATVNEQLVQRKMQIRRHRAEEVIWHAVLVKAIAVAINPITVMDMLGGAVVDVVMILILAKLYGVAMTELGAVALLQKIALSMGGIGASEVLTVLGLSSLKGLLGLAIPVTGGLSLGGYLPVALTQAGIAGFSAYGVGQITKTYLANGAAWGPDGPKALATQILGALDEASILNRIKIELRACLGQDYSDPS